MSDFKRWLEQLGGVAGVRDVAENFEVSKAYVRNWGWEHDVARVGNALIFQIADIEEFEADLECEEECGPRAAEELDYEEGPNADDEAEEDGDDDEDDEEEDERE